MASKFYAEFPSAYIVFNEKIKCFRCMPKIKRKTNSKFQLCSKCLKYFSQKGIIGYTDFEERNDAFKFVIFTNKNQVFRAIILGGGGLCYEPYLKDLNQIWFYDPIQIEKNFEFILEEMNNIISHTSRANR